VKYRPQLLSNIGYDLWSATALFDYYSPLWRGATLALDIYGEHNSKHTPWLLQSHIGDNSHMRGYYPGRYNGNSLVSAQLELRQRIARFVIVMAWAGAGTIFSEYDRFDTSKILPNYGAGLRLYLNATTALRLDVGFGKDCRNFIIGLNEAF
jgi:hemolysin activation/secretion protein